MTRRTIGLLVTLAFTLLVAPLAADAQQAATVHRVGRLLAVGSPAAGPEPSFEAFRQGLRELGYPAGQLCQRQNAWISDRRRRKLLQGRPASDRPLSR
jgi:hypothetical protein